MTNSNRAIRPAIALTAAITILAALGCDSTEDGFTHGDVVASAFTVDVSVNAAVGTVLHSDWSMVVDGVDDAYVMFGKDGEFDRTAEVEHTGDDFSSLLVGLKANTDYDVKAVVVSAGVIYESSVERVRTGGLPSGLPELEVAIDRHPGERSGYILTTVVSDSSVPLLIDADGDIVWWYEPNVEKAKITRSRLARDGKSVILTLSGEEGIHVSDDAKTSYVRRVGLDGTLLQEFTIVGTHHDFVERPDGVLAFIVGLERQPDGWANPAVADAIVEVAPIAGDGSIQKVVWSAWDAWNFAEPDPGVEGSWDLTHCNAIDWHEAAGTYAVSSYAMGTIFTVDIASGQVLEEIGGKFSDYTLANGDPLPFDISHQFQFLGDSLLLFDNGTTETTTSRALELALDSSTGTAEIAWQYVSDPVLYVPALGDVTRLDDGSTLVTWSTAGQLDLVSPDGEVEWRLNLGLGGGLGYTTLIDELGTR